MGGHVEVGTISCGPPSCPITSTAPAIPERSVEAPLNVPSGQSVGAVAPSGVLGQLRGPRWPYGYHVAALSLRLHVSVTAPGPCTLGCHVETEAQRPVRRRRCGSRGCVPDDDRNDLENVPPPCPRSRQKCSRALPMA